MKLPVQRWQRGVRGLWGHLAHGLPVSFDPCKRKLIDTAFGTLRPAVRSFADLGGVWRVEAGYTFYSDLGKKAYFQHVKMDPAIPHYRDFWEKPEEMHPQYQRPWWDIHNVWQWGITDRDLESFLNGLGFVLRHKRNCGRFSSWESFENHAFVFTR